MALGSLDFSNMNFDFGSMDFGGLAQFSLPPTFSVFTPEQSQQLNQAFTAAQAQSAAAAATTPSGPTRKTVQPQAPVPLPVRPPIPDPLDLNGKKLIGTNPDRYTVSDKGWSINSSPSVPPLKFINGQRPINLVPVLLSNGIVVKITIGEEDRYLISPQTLVDITKSGNPHYDIAENGRVLDTPIGRTIPIIQLDMSKVLELIGQRDQANRNAGVKDVVYINETEDELAGLPAGLVDQINYTLDPNSPRPADTFQIWDLGLRGDYQLTNFVIVNKQADGKLDDKKMQTFLKGVKDRQKGFQEDLNLIKRIFYEGRAPAASTFKTYTQVATNNILEGSAGGSSYVIKGSELVDTTKPASETAKDATDKAINEIQNPPPDLSWTSSLPKVRANWANYGFTPTEAESVKNPLPSGNLLIKAKGVPDPINIAINWIPSVCEKARIVANIPEQLPPDTERNPIVQQLVTLFGKINPLKSEADWKQYITVNNNKKAELLHVARIIRDEERTNTISKGGGGAAGGGGDAITAGGDGQFTGRETRSNVMDAPQFQ